MRQVTRAYGRTGLRVDLPDDAAVITPVQHPPAADVGAELRRALREPVSGAPLRERVRKGATVAIPACDGTRAQPRHLMIPAVLEELDGIVDLDDVVVLVATGTHRANTDAELRRVCVLPEGPQTIPYVRDPGWAAATDCVRAKGGGGCCRGSTRPSARGVRRRR